MSGSASMLERLVTPFVEILDESAARKIVAIRADSRTQRRADRLAEKANRGTLNSDERAEYDRLLAMFHFVTIMQAKARRFLRA